MSFKSFKQHSIDVPEDLRKHFVNPQSYRDLVDIVKNIHVEFDEQNSKLVVSVRLQFLLRNRHRYFRASQRPPFVGHKSLQTSISMIPGTRKMVPLNSMKHNWL